MDSIYILPAGTVPTAEVIKDAIKFNQDLSVDYQQLDDYYLGVHSILVRNKAPALKNRKVISNHAKYITDMNVGYLLGNPVDYQMNKGVDIEPLIESFKRQTLSDLDIELAKDCSKFGRTYEYVYINSKGETKSVNLDPRNCIVVYDDTYDMNPMFAIVYELDGSAITKVDLLNEFQIKRMVTDNLQVKEILPHRFGEVPVIEYWNNRELQGDYIQVISLIDAYNFLMSDRVNDKEQLVESILGLYGFGLTKDQKEDLLTYRTLADLPTDGRAEYITKTFNETQIEVLRKAIEQDIHKISMTPNMSDENFVGNSSGVAIAYKLVPFDQNIKNKERLMEKGLKKRIMLYNNYLSSLKKMEKLDVADIDIVFKRNLPTNVLETSQIITNLRGFITDETLAGLLPFVKDASEEVKKAKEEEMDTINAQVPQFGFDTPTKDNKSDNLKSK